MTPQKPEREYVTLIGGSNAILFDTWTECILVCAFIFVGLCIVFGILFGVAGWLETYPILNSCIQTTIP